MFQAYVITCTVSGKHYVGITGRGLKNRWKEHLSDARCKPGASVLYAAIRKYGSTAFTIAPIASASSWDDICAVELILIKQWETIAPSGYNLSPGGKGRGVGFKQSADSVERSAAKHRGRPCHPNTLKASYAQKGKPKTTEHRSRIAAGRIGKPRSAATKAKLATYWAERRAEGAFKTAQPYAHARTFKPRIEAIA